MMILLLLLCASVFMGLSHDGDEYEYDYGDTFTMMLLINAHSIEFKPKHNSDVTILWKHDNPAAIEDSRHAVRGAYYAIFNVTQKDSGRYIMRDKDQNTLSTKTIEVIASTKAYSQNPGESLSFTFKGLEPNSCNIYFFPESDHTMGEKEIVRQGRLKEGLDELDCAFFLLLKPCGILNEDLKTSCSGRFEVRDQNGNNALVVLLEIEPLRNDSFAIGIGVGVLVAALSCCACVRRCCCGRRSSRKDRSAQPSFTPAGPLIHNPPTVNMPPAYSEVSPLVEQAGALTVPVHSDPEPRFELKGMTFNSASLLSSDSTYCDVYNSDKLNFL